jgi:hypothetical protein
LFLDTETAACITAETASADRCRKTRER